MNIKQMRSIHLYLGVFFAPLLIFFMVSGCWQTFDLDHASKKNENYKPPKIIKQLTMVHTDQSFEDSHMPKSSIPFRWLVLLMSLGLVATTILGIIMAFKYTKVWIVWLLIVMGIVVPVFLLWMARH
jgi:hypothetical protein